MKRLAIAVIGTAWILVLIVLFVRSYSSRSLYSPKPSEENAVRQAMFAGGTNGSDVREVRQFTFVGAWHGEYGFVAGGMMARNELRVALYEVWL